MANYLSYSVLGINSTNSGNSILYGNFGSSSIPSGLTVTGSSFILTPLIAAFVNASNEYNYMLSLTSTTTISGTTIGVQNLVPGITLFSGVGTITINGPITFTGDSNLYILQFPSANLIIEVF